MIGSIPGFTDDSFDKDNFTSSAKQVKNVYHLWLIDEIGESKSYLKWFDILQSAGEDDLVVIHINSPGGYIDTAVQLISQIKLSEAQVICQIESACCSAATLIALSCQGLACYPHAYMMIHTSSGCSFGKQSDIRRQEAFYNTWLDNLFKDIYKDFLTGKEIDSVLNGNDIWLTSDEITERFRHKVEIMNREHAKIHKKQQEHMKKLNSFMETLKNNDMDETSEVSESNEGDKKSKKVTHKKSDKKKK